MGKVFKTKTIEIEGELKKRVEEADEKYREEFVKKFYAFYSELVALSYKVSANEGVAVASGVIQHEIVTELCVLLEQIYGDKAHVIASQVLDLIIRSQNARDKHGK